MLYRNEYLATFNITEKQHFLINITAVVHRDILKDIEYPLQLFDYYYFAKSDLDSIILNRFDSDYFRNAEKHNHFIKFRLYKFRLSRKA